MGSDGRRHRLQAARLYLAIEAEVRGRPAVEVVEPALRGGLDVVQLREKWAADRGVLDAARALRELCDRHGALLVVNDRPDLALAAGADGVHLGQNDEDPDSVRAGVGEELLIGISTHSQDQIAAAERSAADYLGIGPVYRTPTKPDHEPVGLDLVRHAAMSARKPFFAIGGIDTERAPAVVAAGARRIAVVRAIRDAADPEAAARSLRRALEREPVGGTTQ
jgi:thiamine-phosphate pyrophosphorylase